MIINKCDLTNKKESIQKTKRQYLLGVDVGTTSIKAAVFDNTGRQISSSNVDYTLIAKGDYIELDANLYWTLFRKAMAEAVGDLDISALSIDTQCETMILTDENGNPLRNAIVWLDNRAAKQASEIEQVFGVKKVYEVTGQPEVTATWPAAKLLWIKQN
ncbi:MAG: hypothetical protein GX800_12500 [Clostridiaceae bacterium]|nr:hypothetical protein [Clostridiaceae bacterium]